MFWICCDWQIPNLTRLWELGHVNQCRGKFSKHQLLTLCDCAVQKVCRRFKSDRLARCFSGVQAALTSMVAVSAHRINRGKSLKSCFLGELRCHWRLHECDINPAALKIISAGIRAGQSSQPGAEEETGATSGLSRRSCTHVVQSRLGERMPASIKKKKKNPTAPVFFPLELLQCAFLGLQSLGFVELWEETAAEESGLRCGMFESNAVTRLLKLTPPVWWKPCFY